MRPRHNAICIVGRRSRTRGLYLDRRAFLTSYDPTQDDDEAITLTRILQPRCRSAAASTSNTTSPTSITSGCGCGTKLPHNITSLLGVMDGAASDLRTGLPWQMVEIHEPVRLLFVIETTPEAMLGLMERNPGIGRLCRNGWVQLATLGPDSNADPSVPRRPVRALPAGVDRAARAWRRSVDWYRGWRDHLGFAEIGGETPCRKAPATA